MLALVLDVACVVVARLPRSFARALGDALAFVAGRVLRIRRRAVEEAMRDAGVVAPALAAREMYRSLGRGVVELLTLSKKPDRLEQMASFDDDALAAIDAALARGPLVVCASHTGNWELSAFVAALALGERGRKVALVVKAIRARAFDAFCTKLRRSFGIELVAPAGALAHARRLLARGDVVAMPIDQVPDRAEHGDRLPFLGKRALVDRAPATLALRTGATILVVAGAREGERHVVRVLGAIEPPKTRADRAGWVSSATAEATALLEAHVRARPESWLWLHRRWKAPRAQACKGALPGLLRQA